MPTDTPRQVAQSEALLRHVIEEAYQNPAKYESQHDAPELEDQPEPIPIIRPPEHCERRLRRQFSYAPLPGATSIRLLEVHPLPRIPNNFGLYLPLKTSLFTVDLEDCPEYAALSHTWGDPQTLFWDQNEVSSPEDWDRPAFDILCNNELVAVRTNLYTALIALRRAITIASLGLSADYVEAGFLHARYIWIDAVCINQNDLEERSSQVMIMSRIYKQAKTVFAWIGGCDPIAAKAIRQLEEISAARPDPRKVETERIEDVEVQEKAGFGPVSLLDWTSISMLLSRSWFKRAWVVQEVALADRLIMMCGQHVFSPVSLFHFLHFVRESNWIFQMMKLVDQAVAPDQSPFYQSLSEARFTVRPPNTVRSRPRRYPDLVASAVLILLGYTHSITVRKLSIPFSKRLFELLWDFRSTEVTDDRDRVYALLGLAEEVVEGGHELRPRYDLSTNDVFTKATRFMISAGKSLDVLSLKEPQPCRDLPSWVPDFGEIYESMLFTLGFEPPWNVSQNMPSHMADFYSERLKVRGLQVGRIVETVGFSWLCDLPRFFSSSTGPVPVPEKWISLGVEENSRETESSQFCMSSDSIPAQREGNLIPSKNGSTNLSKLKDTNRSSFTLGPDSSKASSRFQIMWRTLMADSFDFKRPAPRECGDAFLAIVDRQVHGAWTRCLYSLVDHDDFLRSIVQSDSESQQVVDVRAVITDWNTARKNLGKAYTVQQKLHGRVAYEHEGTLYHPEVEEFKRVLDAHGPRSPEFKAKVEVIGEIMHCSAVTAKSPAFRVENWITKVSQGRQLVKTDSGRVGLASTSATVGDEVWILSGASVPFVLRRVSKDSQYRLVGEAYVHGIMDGEARADPPGLGTETIELI